MLKSDRQLLKELEKHLDPVKSRDEIMKANEESTNIYKYIEEAERDGWPYDTRN